MTARVTLAVLVAGVCCVVGALALSLTGWGFETDPWAQVVRDAPFILLLALAGAVAGAALAWAAAGTRRPFLFLGALLGTAPATVVVAAFFTTRF